LGCEETRELIDAYADSELDLVGSLSVERHLQVCEDCLRAHRKLQALRSLMHNESLYFRPSAGLRKHISSALRAKVKIERHTPLASWGWLAAAASVALVAIATLMFIQRQKGPSEEDLVAREVVSSHVRSLMEPHHTLDVPSSDQHTVKPWFNGKLDFSPPVENSADQGFPLVGGRLDYFGGRSVAALVYQRHQHYINLFIWPSNEGHEMAEKSMSRQGYNLLHWDKSGMEYWAISDLNEPELRQFADIIQNHLHIRAETAD
jgi:anti-sigma factor RsiW